MALTEAPGFWDDHEKAEKIMSSVRKLKNRIEPWKELLGELSDIEAMYELAEESGSSEDEAELREMIASSRQKFEELNVLNLLSGEVDDSSAFITIHSGAGGFNLFSYLCSSFQERGLKLNFSVSLFL